MHDDSVPFAQTLLNLYFRFVAMSHVHLAQFGTFSRNHINAPALSVPENRAYGHFHHVLPGPDNNVSFYPIPIAQRRATVEEIRNNVDALFLYSERRYFREAIRLNQPHASAKRTISSPPIHRNGTAGGNLHGVCRKHLSNDFDVRGVTENQDRCSHGNNSLAFFKHTEHTARTRRAQLNQWRRTACLRLDSNQARTRNFFF